MEKPRVFLCLDALRGTAAIVILLFHVPYFFGAVLFQHGYIAVDFFFMLSGFVLSFAYQEKIDQGGFFLRFAKIRMVRLYPLYFLGLVLGLMQLLVSVHYAPGVNSPRLVGIVVLCGLLLFPVPPGVPFSDSNAFPINSVSWSLFGEIVANVLHVLFLRRRSNAFLGGLLVVMLAAVLYLSHHFGTLGFGWARDDIYIGLSRVMMSYVAGMLLYRLHKSGRVRYALPPWFSCLLLMAVMAIPNSERWQLPIDLALVIVVFPLLILLSGSSDPSPRFASVFRLLGTASYAIYILHKPLASGFDHVWIGVRGVKTELDAPWPGVIYVALILAVSVAMDRFYDAPIRAKLARWLLPNRERRTMGA